ncbi:hypothetical protein CAPTEDRAFT_93026 [Capitella teleta]|uniref:Transmembrane protein 164 n=1 Tax=Capitella teleta TaxID=283909 RepID=R7VHP3_CAPTE|nr:hypothetical protein CAPTEDRAFT_93026 [Capitella teleta]|eukprot:ELU15190.1 hypothetical protein CAPTEDRAFT_93026 [Capitella teleta]
MESSSWSNMLDWTYTGVDHSLPGNGGIECISFIPSKQKIIETAVFLALGFCEILIGLKFVSLSDIKTWKSKNSDPLGKRIFLLAHTLIFGIELGFKFSTRQMIWILNPCHVVTIIQIFLLAAPPSKLSAVVFRLHVHGLSGAIIAMLFPVVNTRLLPFETEVYYIQHLLIIIIPYYLMRQGGAYTTEPVMDYSWCLLMMGMLFVYHWALLQGLAILSLVNLNNMVCPAVSDPFHGRWYRVCAVVHQTATVLIVGKLYSWICRLFVPKHRLEFAEEDDEIPNGHCKSR